ncbi:glycosyl transferase group 1 [Solidesulfovibrio fructosivorans JJ]]|uniref:Glycosyl transferase group 1 n=1 Tax=Solidesulfovibrio fructosivorans JJ] TaxID=596151 RepID=E1JXN6_SOLFR|nr:glycosyltransferase [Solidesulfovibrio fructosivorans]EFL50809.1 glycosyl transferase group 1 [Solidesulfovibrio fructosivorans JJ]]
MKSVVHFVRKSTQLRASFIRNQIQYHVRYAPAVVYKQFSRQNDGGYAALDTAEGLPVLDLSQGATLVEKALFKLAYCLSGRDTSRIVRFLGEQNATVLHFHYGSDAGMYASVMRGADLPSVVSFYGYDCSSFPRMYCGYGGRFLRQNVFGPATRILAMSQQMQDDLVSLGCPREKIVVHYFGTDIGRFAFPAREYPEPTGPVRLLILASFVPQKGHLILLRALRKLLSQGVTDFTLRLVGDGPLHAKLVRYVDEAGLAKHTDFTGAILYGSPEMASAYQEADIFVHPSVTSRANEKEGIPGAIVEAMASGLPVLSTFHSGIPSIIHNEVSGLLVPEYDVTALAEALSRMIADRNLRERLGRRGREHAEQCLNIRHQEKALEAIYDQLIDEGKRPIRDN